MHLDKVCVWKGGVTMGVNKSRGWWVWGKGKLRARGGDEAGGMEQGQMLKGPTWRAWGRGSREELILQVMRMDCQLFIFTKILV